MRNPATAAVAFAPCKLLWAATVLTGCILRANAATPDEESRQSISLDDSLQVDEVSKRDWDKTLKMWGKRGWGQLSGDWGKRKRSIPSAWSDDDSLTIPVVQKRTWQRLHGGWGKRSSDNPEVQDVAAILEQQQDMPDYDILHEDKRKWKPFNEGWGKRNNKWDNFRGSWGKRDPTWVNLKGMWGKRSDYADN